MASIHSSSSCASVPPFATITLGEISQLHDCNGSEVRVYLALAAHAGSDGKCWPGRRRLAEITGQTQQHVSRCTSSLEAAGLIEKSQTPTGRVIYHLPLHRACPAKAGSRCLLGTLPVSDPEPIEQTNFNSEQREADPIPPADPVAAPLSQDLRKAKTSAPDGVPQAWIEAGQVLRPELSIETIQQSAEVFLDHHRAKGTVLTDWLPAWRIWLRRERTPKGPQFAHKPLATPAVPSPYVSPNYGQTAQETAQEAAERFAATMEKYGATQCEGGTWNRPGVVDGPTPTPIIPSILPTSTTTIPPTRRTLTADQQRRLASLVASGLSRAEVATALGRG